jgi:membrane dipeptidase
VGVEHLGVGSDINADAIEPTSEQLQRLKSQYSSSYGFRDKMYIEGLNHSRRVFDLTEGLIRRKYSDESITGILGGNFRRALTQIWPGV